MIHVFFSFSGGQRLLFRMEKENSKKRLFYREIFQLHLRPPVVQQREMKSPVCEGGQRAENPRVFSYFLPLSCSAFMTCSACGCAFLSVFMPLHLGILNLNVLPASTFFCDLLNAARGSQIFLCGFIYSLPVCLLKFTI